MLMSVDELHRVEFGGCEYWLRTPTVYDEARLRRTLGRQRIRRPDMAELRVAALAGVEAMAEAVGDREEGARQRQLLEDWYEATKPIREDDIDEPDLEARAVEFKRRKVAAEVEAGRLWPQVAAIEANLERHCPAYAELLADRNYWDEVSRIDVVRLLLARRADIALARDGEDMLTPSAYRSIPIEHRIPLANACFKLLAPDEDREKN